MATPQTPFSIYNAQTSPPLQPYAPNTKGIIINNAPYLPDFTIVRTQGLEGIKSRCVELLCVMNAFMWNTENSVNNFGVKDVSGKVKGGWMYSESLDAPGAKAYSSEELNDSSNWSLRQISGGITNDLYLLKCTLPNITVGSTSNEGALIRLFGAEEMIIRDIENASYAALCDANIAYKYLGRFGKQSSGGGRIEGFLKNFACLGVKDLSDHSTSVSIAQELANIHSFVIPEYLKEVFVEGQSSLFSELSNWLGQANNAIYGPNNSTYYAGIASDLERAEKLNIKKCGEGIERLKKYIEDSGEHYIIKFCHNDLLCANVMRSISPEGKASIKLIDYEYGGVNYVAFDIANHFNEWAGGTDDAHPRYELLPNDVQKETFVREYTMKLNELLKTNHSDIEIKANTKTTLNQVRIFEVLNHFYWGLWAVNQASTEGVEKFEFLTYADKRLARGRMEFDKIFGGECVRLSKG